MLKPDKEKSREELIQELVELRKVITDLSNQQRLEQKDQELLNKLNQQAESLSVEDVKKLILDHQIYSNELEQQNEELRDTQNRLDASRKKYSELFNLAPFGYLLLDNKGVILETNVRIAQLLEREQMLLNNKPFVAHVVGEDQAEFFIFLKKVITSGDVLNRDLRVITAKKNILDVYVSGIRLQSDDNTTVGCMIALTDVSDLKNTQRLLQESEEKHRMLIDNIKDGIFILQNSLFKFINPAFYTMFGYEKSEVIGKSFVDFISPEDKEFVVNRYKRRLQGEDVPTNYEFRVLHKNGIDLIFVDMHVSLISYQGAVATLGIVKDISDKKATEFVLKQTESLYNSTLNLLPDYIFVVDENLRVILANTALLEFQAQHGYVTDIKEKFYYDVFEGFDEHAKSEYKRVFETGRETFKEIKYNHNGDTFFFEILKTPVFQNDAVVRVITTIRDVTQKKNDEINIKKYADELKELNNTKDQFISILAHDLKNPFTSLMSISDYMSRQVDKLSKDKIAKLSRNINTSSRQIFKLLENLLQWAHIQAGKFEFYPKMFTITDVVDEVFLLFQSAAQTKNITLENNITISVEVFADYNMVETVLRNLISNAIKFTNHGGWVKVSAEKTDDAVIIKVADNGIGISDEYIEKIFGIEENFSMPGTDDEKGTGFGLVLCKEFINLHKGRLWAESTVDKGSTFMFTLPISKSSHPDLLGK